jgi:hypothetical protein
MRKHARGDREVGTLKESSHDGRLNQNEFRAGDGRRANPRRGMETGQTGGPAVNQIAVALSAHIASNGRQLHERHARDVRVTGS